MISEDEIKRQIIEDGVKAMTESIIKLIKPCIEQRCRQFVKVIEDELGKEQARGGE